ncbi:MAG: outer membrane lipoprotein carrier protein LolA [Sedimentisphaerales bacterium]|jgi:outer membrane lipoprotein-sorting protein
MLRALVVSVVVMWMCGFASCAEVSSQGEANALSRKTNELRSYQCGVEYLFSQPVLESKTLKTGSLCYARFGGGSKLRINFDTLTQDEGPQQKYADCYIFDGQWLTHIDYQIKQVRKKQLAEANEPVDAFELARKSFPIIGFGKTEDLEKEFDVNQMDDSNQIVHLHLTVKPDSQYKDDYRSVEVWIDKGLMLPAKISAVSTEGDIYEIKFVSPLVNEKIDEKVFDVKIPDGFGRPEIIPLKK